MVKTTSAIEEENVTMTSSIKISTTITMQGIREGTVIRQEIADVGQDIE